jgi:Tol biopolymer transport system component
MLRLKILVSAVPLIAAAILARVELVPSQHPCIAIGADTLQIADAPWHADLHVSFTDNPALATIRVALTDRAESADFAVIDDAEETEDATCTVTPSTQFVAVSARPSAGAPVIYLSPDDGSADYRIFVRSKRFSAREAAALIVGAHGERPRLAAAL